MMLDLEKAKLNPADQFKHPRDVLLHPELSREMKIDILRRWAYDERELQVAEEENMFNAKNNRTTILDDILKCLLELGLETDHDSPPPTKHG